MFGLLNLFGRSAALKAADRALRRAGLHPVLVPEAVKLTILRLHKKDADSERTSEDALDEAAQLFAYCMLGRDQFIDANSVSAADSAERRLEWAIVAGESLDAQLILLAHHSGLIHEEIADRIDVEKD
ncbi:MAG: hypothetical protein K2X62_10510 [Beijerinckiaceae bacterium]|nr:hypothetical protein [Beijerinckiaceae bacterium]